MNFGCVVLAAGYSTRFGFPKALAELCNGKLVINYLLEKLLSTNIQDIVLVLGANYDKILPHVISHQKITIVFNKNYELGQTVSFQTGVQHLKDETQAFFLIPIDSPFIRNVTLNDLMILFTEKVDCFSIVVPTYKHKRGHPPLFSGKLKEKILKLDVDSGINTLIHSLEDQTHYFSINDPGVTASFNTILEFEAINKLETL